MRLVYRLLLPIVIIIPIASFDCDSVLDSLSCNQLKNCTWTENNECTGMFSPDCNIPNCYYIDPMRGSDSQDGSASTPFKSLTAGFQALSGIPGTIIVINDIPKVEAQILAYTFIISDITVK